MEQFRPGRPSQDVIDKVQQLEIAINSGNLDEADETDREIALLDLAGRNFDSLPESIKGLLDVTASDKTKKLVALNVLRLYAFPNDPMEIGTALDNLMYRSGTDMFKNNPQGKNNLFRAIESLSEDEHFRKILAIQVHNY
jgi:hypothetical protein